MYTPKHFTVDDDEILHAVMRENSFAIMVTAVDGATTATHLPFSLDTGTAGHGVLQAHMARANPQWEAFADGIEAMVVFQGPHTYISPTWYETVKAVPTWNYVAVHAYGRPRVIDDPDTVLATMRRLVGEYETPDTGPWDMDTLPEKFLNAMVRGIVAFEIPIERLEGKFKLSQNRPDGDRERVAAELKSVGGDQALGVAGLMEDLERNR